MVVLNLLWKRLKESSWAKLDLIITWTMIRLQESLWSIVILLPDGAPSPAPLLFYRHIRDPLPPSIQTTCPVYNSSGNVAAVKTWRMSVTTFIPRICPLFKSDNRLSYRTNMSPRVWRWDRTSHIFLCQGFRQYRIRLDRQGRITIGIRRLLNLLVLKVSRIHVFMCKTSRQMNTRCYTHKTCTGHHDIQ